MKAITFLSILLAGLLFSSCDVTNNDQFSPEFVVEAYLFANAPLPPVRLSQTVPFGEKYIFDEQAVGNATVSLQLLDSNGAVETSFDYSQSQPGIYQAANPAATVLPRRSYALEIRVPNNETVIRSQTTIPDSFQILQSTADTIQYLATDQLEITVTPSFSPGRQNIFVFSTESFEPEFENLTPLWVEFFDEESDDTTEYVEDFRITESPPINEGNYDLNGDGTLTIRLPWIAINFYGRNRISVAAIDDNIFDFMVSHEIQRNPSTLSPGEIPAIIDNIEGGTGVFGSYARVIKDVVILRN